MGTKDSKSFMGLLVLLFWIQVGVVAVASNECVHMGVLDRNMVWWGASLLFPSHFPWYLEGQVFKVSELN